MITVRRSVYKAMKGQSRSAAPFIPPAPTLPKLERAAQSCKGCDLYLNATQAVLGAGPASARIMIVGEQPGDREDIEGKPFVGPAGKLLDKALAAAGIDRSEIYVTNAVKHFKNEPRGKRRIHKKPSATEVNACRPWLETELDLIQPDVIVCLGATAAQAILGRDFRLTKDRGVLIPHQRAKYVLATVHPSSLLRMPEGREQAYELFVEDLRAIKKAFL
jgi:uracil-DNA glycosylase family protein